MADARIKSVFGTYADQLQVMVDSKLDTFAPLWYPRYFPMGIPSMSLTFSQAIGRSRIEAAAAVVNRDSPAPLGSRQTLEKLSLEVPAIKKKFKMSETDYRDFMTLQSMSVSDQTKKQQLLDLMWRDVAKAGAAPSKQIDRMVLEALSTGSVTLTTTNNPEGIITDTIDMLMPSGNKVFCSVVWATSASSKPMDDIKTTVETAQARGIQFEKMLMTLTTFWNLVNATDTKAKLAGFFKLGTTGATRIGTLEEINQMLAAWMFPTIEIVNQQIGIEKDGTITASNPFLNHRVSFIPSGNLGEIKNAISVEEMAPVSGVVYAKANGVLISKWSHNDPFGEYTMGELNAFPAIDAIDSIYIMNTEATS